jgi:hypothetical protein
MPICVECVLSVCVLSQRVVRTKSDKENAEGEAHPRLTGARQASRAWNSLALCFLVLWRNGMLLSIQINSNTK